MRAISRVALALVIIVVVIAASVGTFLYESSVTTTPTNSTSSISSSVPQTLTIETADWPLGSLNALQALYIGLYADYQAYTSWQTLVTVNATSDFLSGTVQYLPDIATSWTVSPDGTLYTFDLRPNVTFSNGDPFNAYQVWTVFYGFYYLSANSTGWYGGYPIFDMSSVQFGPSSISLLQSSGLSNPSSQALAMMTNSLWPIYVVNQTAIAFHLAVPFRFFLGTLLGMQNCIFDAQYVLQNGGFGTPASFNTNFNLNAIPGTGPYMVSNVVNRELLEFTQNLNYWGKSLPASILESNPYISPGSFKNVLIKVVPDATTRYIDLSSGAAQMVDSLGAADFKLILANPSKFGYITFPSTGGDMAVESFNTRLYPTNITDVRLAIVHAINYTDFIDESYGTGAFYPTVGPEYPLWSQYYDLGNYPLYSYNVTLAEQYLAEAGFPNGKGLPTLTWTIINDCALCITRANIAQGYLSQIGINVNIQLVTFDQWCAIICNPYSYLINNTNTVSNIMDPEGPNAQPVFLSPADYWTDFVSDLSPVSNTAIYSTPITEACQHSFFNASSIATTQSICARAQAQIYKDAPYWGWGSTKYVAGDSSPAWDKNVVQSGYMDPIYSGISTIPIFNTISPASTG